MIDRRDAALVDGFMRAARRLDPTPVLDVTEIIHPHEAWDVFDSNGSTDGPVQIQAVDELCAFGLGDAPFRDDSDAWLFVVNEACEGHARSIEALFECMDYNPPEFDRIVAWWMANGVTR